MKVIDDYSSVSHWAEHHTIATIGVGLLIDLVSSFDLRVRTVTFKFGEVAVIYTLSMKFGY